MPLCPSCGRYYVHTCECGYHDAESVPVLPEAPSHEGEEEDAAVSPARRRIFDFLHGVNEAFTVKQVAKEAAVSESTVRKTFSELVEEGLILSEESPSGTLFYELSEKGFSRYRYGTDTLGLWSEPRDQEKLFLALLNNSVSQKPVTIRSLRQDSGASEYLVRKTVKTLEKEGNAICDNPEARPREYLVKKDFLITAIEILKPRKSFRDVALQELDTEDSTSIT